MRSLTLLELLDSPADAESAEPRQISIEQDHQLLWFEASCARVRSLPEQGGSSTLLVLHDITQLKRLEMMRRDFVANVSHELRTPLTIIKGYAETLAEDGDAIKPEARNRFLARSLPMRTVSTSLLKTCSHFRGLNRCRINSNIICIP